jgi:hypothetical protein
MEISTENKLDAKSLETTTKVEKVKPDNEKTPEKPATPEENSDFRVDLSKESLAASSQLKSAHSNQIPKSDLDDEKADQMAAQVRQDLARLHQGITGATAHRVINEFI